MVSGAQLACLILIWALWCGLHSLLLQHGLRRILQQRLRLTSGRFRLAYSLVSLATLYPVYKYTVYLGGFHPFWWYGAWLWPQLGLLGLAVFLLLWSGWDFSKGGFDLLGLSSAFKKQDSAPRLITGGAYAHMRHPMHLAALIAVWSRSINQVDLVVSILLTAYICLGTWHEEARLRRQFGEEYRAYAKKVPLVPFLK